jgi:hypothetical protein
MTTVTPIMAEQTVREFVNAWTAVPSFVQFQIVHQICKLLHRARVVPAVNFALATDSLH